jgi:hypothetical protein
MSVRRAALTLSVAVCLVLPVPAQSAGLKNARLLDLRITKSGRVLGGVFAGGNRTDVELAQIRAPRVAALGRRCRPHRLTPRLQRTARGMHAFGAVYLAADANGSGSFVIPVSSDNSQTTPTQSLNLRLVRLGLALVSAPHGSFYGQFRVAERRARAARRGIWRCIAS